MSIIQTLFLSNNMFSHLLLVCLHLENNLCKKSLKCKFKARKKVQSNLSTTATLWTPKKLPLYIGGCSVEGFQSKLVPKLAWPDLVLPLLTSGHCSEVAVNTGLTVARIKESKKNWRIFYDRLFFWKPFFQKITVTPHWRSLGDERMDLGGLLKQVRSG